MSTTPTGRSPDPDTPSSTPMLGVELHKGACIPTPGRTPDHNRDQLGSPSPMCPLGGHQPGRARPRREAHAKKLVVKSGEGYVLKR
jgi:hypothetical protein